MGRTRTVRPEADFEVFELKMNGIRDLFVERLPS